MDTYRIPQGLQKAQVVELGTSALRVELGSSSFPAEVERSGDGWARVAGGGKAVWVRGGQIYLDQGPVDAAGARAQATDLQVEQALLHAAATIAEGFRA